MNKNELKTAIIGVLLSGGVFTQAQTSNTSTVQVDNTDRYKVETNHFFDNWLVGAGIGGQVYSGKNDGKLSLSKRITPSYNLYLGKWFTPGLGLRVGIDGSKANALTLNNSNWYESYYNTGETYKKDGATYYKQKIKYTHVNAEALFNLTNLLAGYKENRFYNIIPHAGFGWLVAVPKNGSREDELSIIGGLLNTFRISNAIDLTLDLKGTLTNGRFSHKETVDVNQPGSKDYIANVVVGVVYKFKKRNWDKPTIVTNTVVSYNDEELNKLRQRADVLAKENNALNKENDALKEQLANKKEIVKTETIVDKSVLTPPLLITFQINESSLSKEARVNLGYFAKLVKEKPGITYTITGYADKATGTSAINEKLSKDRAKVVYDALINEFGVSPSRLKTSYEGGVGNLFYDDPRLSRSVIAFETK